MCFYLVKIDQAGGPETFLTLLGLIMPNCITYMSNHLKLIIIVSVEICNTFHSQQNLINIFCTKRVFHSHSDDKWFIDEMSIDKHSKVCVQ